MVQTLARVPSVYGIFKTDKQSDTMVCVFVGQTYNLRYTIFKHFHPLESNLHLRHIMSSDEEKYLRYVVIIDFSRISSIEHEWRKRYNPKF